MSFYRKKPSRWTGDTGRALRGDLLTQCVADYLMAPVNGSAYGVYPLDLDDVSKHIGISVPDAARGLQALERLGFSVYDGHSRYVWVREMAAHQFDLPLEPRSFLIAPTKRWYVREHRNNPFLGSWFDRYAVDFHLTTEPEPTVRRDDRERIPAIVEPEPTLLFPIQPEAVELVAVPDRRKVLVPAKPHPIRDMLAYFEAGYIQRFGEKPVIDGGKDAKIMERLLISQGPEKVRAVIDQLFVTDDEFIANTGYTVGVLKSCFNKLALEKSGPIRRTAKTSKTASAVQRFAERGRES